MPRPAPIVDTGDIKIFKPEDEDTYVLIYLPKAPEGYRKIKVTVEELFDLTDVLDDLCDAIEEADDG